VIYDDVPQSGAHEFLGLDTPAAGAEPAGWMALGCGPLSLIPGVRSKLGLSARFDVH
jgi:hypothetical protein